MESAPWIPLLVRRCCRLNATVTCFASTVPARPRHCSVDPLIAISYEIYGIDARTFHNTSECCQFGMSSKQE